MKRCSSGGANSKARSLSCACNRETASKGPSASWSVVTGCVVPAIKVLQKLICKTNSLLRLATSKDGSRSSLNGALKPDQKLTYSFTGFYSTELRSPVHLAAIIRPYV